MKRWLIVILLSLGAGFWLGRQTLEELRETFFPTTPREAYVQALEASGLAGTALGRLWVRAADEALRTAPRLAGPFRETGYFDPARAEAVAYRFAARAGQRLGLDVRLDPPSNTLLFLDLFRVPERAGDELDHVLSADSAQMVIEFEPRRDGDYILRIQPELLRGGRYTITATLGPTLAFPVSDAGMGSVRSFWGDPRDGGARDHHGVDIFAPRGTPVVAATDGRVSRVRSTQIGGNVVWLRDERRGQSLYYAHLSRQLVESGQMVRQGDTLGLVGNTGNARTTPPHLHFGIYRRGSGPVDPLPFVRPVPGAPTDPAVPLDALGRLRRTATAGVRLRAAPTEDADVLRELDSRAPLHVLGATVEWYRVRAPDGSVGYVAGRLTEPLAAIESLPVAGPAPLRDRPDSTALEIARLEPGDTVEVLGATNGHLFVRARGRQAWVARGAMP